MDSIKNIPTDEQIAAWLSGTCDEAERQAVERYLDENPEAVDDMLNIAMAATVQAKHDAERTKVKKVVFRPAVWAAAASAALVLVVGGVLLSRPKAPEGIAELRPNEQTERIIEQIENNDDDRGTATTVDIPSKSEVAPERRERVSDTPTPAGENNVEQGTDNQPVPMRVQRTERVNTASGATVDETTITVILPRRKREVVPVGTDLLFRWTSDAPSLTLTLTDGEGDLLLRTNLPSNGEYKVPASKLEGVADVQWMLTAPGAAMHSGKIEIIND